jgi:hypothetical protein
MAALIGGLFFIVGLLLNENFNAAYEPLFSSAGGVAMYGVLVGKIGLGRKCPCIQQELGYSSVRIAPRSVFW